MMMESLTSCFLWSVVVILAFLTASKSNTAAVTVPHDIFNNDVENVVKGNFHYHRLVWDPTSRTVSVFNVSGTSPLHVILIRKNVGNCQMFFLRLKGISQPMSMIACVWELSATRLEQKCNWVNNSDALNINHGTIYGMQGDCGPWYMTIYTPGMSNSTELSVEVSESYDPLAFRWFRVITNLAFLPAVFLALKRRFYAEAIIYFLNFILSGMYHLCEAELHCLKGYSRLHYSDMYVSDLSVIATIWAMTRMAPPKKHLLLLAIAILLQFVVIETVNSSHHFYINLVFAGPALLYVCFQYVYLTVKYGRIYPSLRR